MNAPVVVFVYNRPQHTEKTLRALNANTLANQSHLIIYADGLRKESEREKVAAVRKIIRAFAKENQFLSVEVVEHEKNLGLAKSVISGVTQQMEHCGKVIVVEDDLVTSTDFLQYMNDALNYYEQDEKIWSISGYSFPMQETEHAMHDVFMSYRGCSWGWATWQDRWNSVDWNVSDYAAFVFHHGKRRRFNRGGSDLSDMLDLQMRGRIDSWAIRWCYAQSKQEKWTVYPVRSKVENIGCDGSGTHSGYNSHFATVCHEGACRFETLSIDPAISSAFTRHYAAPSFIGNCKSLVKRVLFLLGKK